MCAREPTTQVAFIRTLGSDCRTDLETHGVLFNYAGASFDKGVNI